MLNLLKNIWGIYWYLIFIGVFFILSPILFLMLAIAPLRKHVNWFRVQWGRLTFGLTLMPWKIQYAEAYKDLKRIRIGKVLSSVLIILALWIFLYSA